MLVIAELGLLDRVLLETTSFIREEGAKVGVVLVSMLIVLHFTLAATLISVLMMLIVILMTAYLTFTMYLMVDVWSLAQLLLII